jgi:N,N'-diacetyllegionaminate synthase
MKVIAETASNHMGELPYLKKLSLESKNAGAELITVQVLDLEAFVTPYDKLSYPNFVKVAFSQKEWINYFEWCNSKSINVLPCILDYPSAKMCIEQGFSTVKIHASDIVNINFLKYVNTNFDKVFLEFGGADLKEISTALSVLKSTEVVLLYGFNAYPTKIENQNLNFLKTLNYLFSCKTGFCDHSINNEFIPLLAMAKGASYLEKHVTLDSKNEDRFDWQVSVEPTELKKMVNLINEYLPSFGDPFREVSDSEKHFRKLVYKKIIAKRLIKKGELLKIEDVVYKRSIEGVESTLVSDLVGLQLKRTIAKDGIISQKDLLK